METLTVAMRHAWNAVGLEQASITSAQMGKKINPTSHPSEFTWPYSPDCSFVTLTR